MAYPYLDRNTEQDDKEVGTTKLALELYAVDINNGTMSKRQDVRARLNPNAISNVRAQRMHVVQLIATRSIWH
jgi:outer membrane protein assembly factor BamB